MQYALIFYDLQLILAQMRVYAAPKGAATWGKDWEVRVLTDTHGPFEQGERPRQVALAE